MNDLRAWMSWFVHVNDPSFSDMWRDNPTFLLANILYITMAVLSLTFGLKRGLNSRYTYLWFAVLLHGTVTEMVSYNFPDINNFWQTQTFMMFAGKRFPLYIVLFYPATVVFAYIAASRLNLPWWAEPFAVGLFDLLLDFPYDIMGIKMVWWTWHDTDPNIGERHYWVPWTSYLFHMAFHSSLAFLINATRYMITGSSSKDKSSGVLKEVLCVLITGMSSMGFAVLTQFIPVYHRLKDGFGISSEIIVCILVAFYASIVWYADRTPSAEARGQLHETSSAWWKVQPGAFIILYYLFYMVLVVFARPQDVVSYGMREPLGPKTEMVKQYTAAGIIYEKQRYFDPVSYDEGCIDFHCTPDGVPNITAHPDLIGSDWYTVCGTEFDNHWEYIVMVWSFCLLGLFVFYNALSRSATQALVDRKVKQPIRRSKKSSKND